MRTFYATFILLTAATVISACVKDSSDAHLPGVIHSSMACPSSADLPPTIAYEFPAIVPVYGGVVIREDASRSTEHDILIDGGEHMLPHTEKNPVYYRGGCSSNKGITIHEGNAKIYYTVVYERQGDDYIRREFQNGKIQSERTIKRPRPTPPPAPPTKPAPPAPPPPPPPPPAKITVPRHNIDQCPKQDDFGSRADSGNVEILNIADGISFEYPGHEKLEIAGKEIKSGPISYAGGCDNRTITIQFLKDGSLTTVVIKPNSHGFDRITTDDKGNTINESYPPKDKGN